MWRGHNCRPRAESERTTLTNGSRPRPRKGEGCSSAGMRVEAHGKDTHTKVRAPPGPHPKDAQRHDTTQGHTTRGIEEEKSKKKKIKNSGMVVIPMSRCRRLTNRSLLCTMPPILMTSQATSSPNTRTAYAWHR
jgi:hypothetical protein